MKPHPLTTLCFLLAIVAATPGCQPSGEKRLSKTSDRGEMATSMILHELAAQGYSGDSIKLDFDSPFSVVMRLYSVSDGKPKIVQSSHPTVPSKSFEIGYLFRPAKDKARSLSFIFYDHERPTKGVGSDLENQESTPHWITRSFTYSVSSMGSVRMNDEFVVYYTADMGELEDSSTAKAAAKSMGAGYMITATLDKNGEQDATGRPAPCRSDPVKQPLILLRLGFPLMPESDSSVLD